MIINNGLFDILRCFRRRDTKSLINRWALVLVSALLKTVCIQYLIVRLLHKVDFFFLIFFGGGWKLGILKPDNHIWSICNMGSLIFGFNKRWLAFRTWAGGPILSVEKKKQLFLLTYKVELYQSTQPYQYSHDFLANVSSWLHCKVVVDWQGRGKTIWVHNTSCHFFHSSTFI